MNSKGKIAVIGGLGALILVGMLFIKVQAQEKPFELSDEANRALVSSNYDTSGEPVLLRYAPEIGQETRLTYRFNINANVPQMGPVDAKMKVVAKERVVAVHEDIATIEYRFSGFEFDIPGEDIPKHIRREAENVLQNVKITAQRDARGNIEKMQVTGLPAELQTVATTFLSEMMNDEAYVAEFPETPIKAGDTWTDRQAQTEEGVDDEFVQKVTYHGISDTHWGRLRAMTTKVNGTTTTVEEDLFSKIETTANITGEVKSLRDPNTMSVQLERGQITFDLRMKDLNSNVEEQVKATVRYTAEPVADKS